MDSEAATNAQGKVAQMFSFLETMRLQGDDAIAQLCELHDLGRSCYFSSLID